ncbi:hypothetical protein [Lysobacter fragariae]
MSAQPATTITEDLLAQARSAWIEKGAAEATLSRLARYRGHTPGMKYDAARASDRLSQANETLRRILGAQA